MQMTMRKGAGVLACKIVFMGTPEFAVCSLQRLLDDGWPVAAVFSQPDRPRGRGYRLMAPPVKELAVAQNLPVFQPANLQDADVLRHLRELRPDVLVVVAYGRILPPEVLEIPRLGCINVHASLLPAWRGAAPVQRAIMQGAEKTGVTTMHIAEQLDAGDMILQRETAIGPEETAGELFGRLALLGADCLVETLPLLLAGTAPRTPQDSQRVTWAPPIQKAEAYVDFSKPAEEIHNLVRGMHPSPVAKTRLHGKLVRLHQVRVAEGSGEPGRVLDAKRPVVACGDGALELVTVQPEGKKAMPGADFARGQRLETGQQFEF